MIFQDYELMPGVPAVENAAMKLLAEPLSLPAACEKAAAWLERVGLGHRLKLSRLRCREASASGLRSRARWRTGHG